MGIKLFEEDRIMIFEKPLVEFVALTPSDTIATSDGTGGVDSCNGATAQNNNCNHFSIAGSDSCGYYDQIDINECAHYAPAYSE